MRIWKARQTDFSDIHRLAGEFGLEYPGMEEDAFFVAEEGRRIIGIGALKRHKGFMELCSLGVEEKFRGRGAARQLVRALIRQTSRDIYLATLIPEFFEKFGFTRSGTVPPSMVKDPEWCEGCRKELCTVMKRKGR